MIKKSIPFIGLGVGIFLIVSVSAVASMPVIKELIEFTSINSACAAPPMLMVDMTHTPGTKTRDFALPKDSAYSELINFSRWPSSQSNEMGYFTDQAVSKSKDHVVTMSGRVSSYSKDGKTFYEKSGTWMDSHGCFGTWIDKEQLEHGSTPLAACHVATN